MHACPFILESEECHRPSPLRTPGTHRLLVRRAAAYSGVSVRSLHEFTHTNTAMHSMTHTRACTHTLSRRHELARIRTRSLTRTHACRAGPRPTSVLTIVSIAQFRPEKDHALQLRAFALLLRKAREKTREGRSNNAQGLVPDAAGSTVPRVRLVLAGAVRSGNTPLRTSYSRLVSVQPFTVSLSSFGRPKAKLLLWILVPFSVISGFITSLQGAFQITAPPFSYSCGSCRTRIFIFRAFGRPGVRWSCDSRRCGTRLTSVAWRSCRIWLPSSDSRVTKSTSRQTCLEAP
eukprot:6205480-Pleurochrysis_carterae.AAC.2